MRGLPLCFLLNQPYPEMQNSGREVRRKTQADASRLPIGYHLIYIYITLRVQPTGLGDRNKAWESYIVNALDTVHLRRVVWSALCQREGLCTRTFLPLLLHPKSPCSDRTQPPGTQVGHGDGPKAALEL